jgi:predicted porin
MNRTTVSAACLSALALLGAGVGQAHAQSSVTLYGTLDVGIDRIEKGEGNVQGTLFGLRGTTPIPNAIASPSSTSVRVSPSHTRQSNFGIRGVEDLGGGYRGLFVLEGGLTIDNGGLANDGRLFGRQAYVGLTTPVGEVKAGRQASPMLIAYYLVTPEAIGSTDLFSAGLTVNTLQTFQDNQISYAVKQGPWTAIASFSTNAGVGNGVSAARSFPTATTPAAGATTGQIVGGLTAGAETTDHRGRAVGAMLAWRGESLTVLGSYHRNDFGGVPLGVVSGTTLVPLFNIENYRAYMGSFKYILASTGTTFAFVGHQGKFDLGGNADPVINTWGATIKQAIGQVDISAHLLDTRFTNYTRGRERGLMVGLDYNFSKRTALYTRVGGVKDKRGNIVRGAITPLPIAGGPGALLLPLGSQEVPLFAGAGQNLDAKTTIVSLGIRHAF